MHYNTIYIVYNITLDIAKYSIKTTKYAKIVVMILTRICFVSKIITTIKY